MSKEKKTIGENVSITRFQAVLDVLWLVNLEKENIIEMPYTLKSGDNALVYDMACLVVELIAEKVKKRKEREVPDVLFQVIVLAQKEIDIIYAAILRVGLNQSMDDWKNAALECFDFSPTSYQAVKREYLEERGLYELRPDHEAVDFRCRLLQIILTRNGFRKYGREHIKDALVEIKNRQK